MKTWKRLQVLVTVEQHKWLREQAHKAGISMGNLLRRLIDRAAVKQEKD